MKKFLLMVAMMLTMTVYSFANDNDATKLANTEKYELKINHRRLACFLALSKDQIEIYDDIITELERDMVLASYMDSEEGSNKIVANAIKKNVKYMYYILNKEQYRKYLTLINLTLQNKGFDIIAICK